MDGKTVRMYTCGPTVYNYVHIGNLRTFTFQDILRRWLRARGYELEPRHEYHGRGRQDHPQRDAAGQDAAGVHGGLREGVSRRHATRCASNGPSGWCARPSTSRKWWTPSRSSTRRASPTRATDRSITASRSSRNTASFRIWTSAAFAPARAWTWTNTTRPMRATSCSGRRRRMTSLSGTRRSARAGPAGTSSAPSWR